MEDYNPGIMLVPDDVRVIFQDTTFTDMRSLTDDVVGGLVGTLTRRNRAGHDLLDTETGAPIGNRLVYMLTPEDIEDHQFAIPTEFIDSQEMDQEGQTMLCNSFLNQPMRGTYSTTTDNKTMIGEVWHDFCFSCDLRIGSVVLVKVEKGLEDYNMFLTIDIIEK